MVNHAPKTNRRGLTLIEVLISTLCLATLFTLIACVKKDRQGVPIRDESQLMQIHKAMIAFSNDNRGMYPRPGLIDRLPVPDLGKIPGVGEEDLSKNHTANLYSCLIAMAYTSPGLVVSPVEVNPFVEVKDDYDVDMYSPSNGIYWDPTFTARIDDAQIGSNTSYAHLDLVGPFAEANWRNNMNALAPVLSNRGPRDGATVGDEFARSPTLRFYRSFTAWTGNVAFGDHSVQFLNSILIGEGEPKDNLFRFDTDDHNDARLGIFKSSDGKTSEAVWDPLIDAE